MRHRKRLFVLLSVLYLLFTFCIPVMVQAEVEWNTVSILKLDKSPIDVFTTVDGRWAYILTPGEVQVYSLNTKSLEGRVPVDKGVRRISASTRGDQLFLMNEKTKTLSVISVAFVQKIALVQKIDVKGSPFKGPAAAPVVIVVFSDYQ